MTISRTGGLIAAASKKATQPTLKLGNITVVQRIVLTLQQAGVFPIVVVTGVEADEVKYSLSDRGVVFLYNAAFKDPELLESVHIGLAFLKGMCQRVVFAPVNVPFFAPATLNSILAEPGDIVVPSFQHHGGHPVVLADRIIPDILSYQGDDGLRGALNAMKEKRRWVDVTDEGVLLNVHQADALKDHLQNNPLDFLQPSLHFCLEEEQDIFNARAKLLLLLIGKTHSVRTASGMMAMSVSKAWNTINRLEAALGYDVIERHQGGQKGSSSDLTPQGLDFLKAFQRYEEDVLAFSRRTFGEKLRASDKLHPQNP